VANSSAGAQVAGPTDASSVTGGISLFENQDMTAVTAIIILVVVILTVANSLAPKFAGGGSNLQIASYMSVMCLISAGILGVVPALTSSIFS